MLTPELSTRLGYEAGPFPKRRDTVPPTLVQFPDNFNWAELVTFTKPFGATKLILAPNLKKALASCPLRLKKGVCPVNVIARAFVPITSK